MTATVGAGLVASKVRQAVERQPIPAALADVAMVDGPSIAAAAGMSISAFLALVRRGEAPQPVIRRPRFTRWRLADARTWLIERAERGGDAAVAAQVNGRAVRASFAAQAKRRAAQASKTGA